MSIGGCCCCCGDGALWTPFRRQKSIGPVAEEATRTRQPIVIWVDRPHAEPSGVSEMSTRPYSPWASRRGLMTLPPRFSGFSKRRCTLSIASTEKRGSIWIGPPAPLRRPRWRRPPSLPPPEAPPPWSQRFKSCVILRDFHRKSRTRPGLASVLETALAALERSTLALSRLYRYL